MSDKGTDSRKPTPDPSASERWKEVAEGWHRWIPRMRAWYAPATTLMLDLARIGPGSRVLDVAAGDGDQSLAAAERVGASGYVLATDPTAELLAFAKRSAEQAGVENFETRVMEGEHLLLEDGSFDAVICRFGLRFLDPDRGLREMNRVLRRRGRVSLVVYGVDGSPEFSLALSVALRRLGLSEDGLTPGATNLGEQEVLEQLLGKAGFGEFEMHEMALPIRMASAAECVSYLKDASPTLRGVLSSSSPADREEVWQEIEQALSTFEGPSGFVVDHRVLIAAGTAV